MTEKPIEEYKNLDDELTDAEFLTKWLEDSEPLYQRLEKKAKERQSDPEFQQIKHLIKYLPE